LVRSVRRNGNGAHSFHSKASKTGARVGSGAGKFKRADSMNLQVQNCRRAVLGESPWNLIGPVIDRSLRGWLL
jgi:hypothetical protein